MVRDKKLGLRKIIGADLEIMPLMNLFVVLIPMLLLSAVFLEMSVIRMNVPPEVAREQGAEGEREDLLLAVTIHPDRYVVEGRNVPTTVIRRGGEESGSSLGGLLHSISVDHPENDEVIIIAQPETRYEPIVRVMDIAREAGLPEISLLGAEGD